MSTELLVALVTGAFSVLAVWLTSRKASADMDAKLDKQQAVFEAVVTERIGSLQKRVEEHNSIVTKTYELEKSSALHEAELKRLNKRIANMEGAKDEG